MGAPAFVYVAPEGLIRCEAKNVMCGPKPKNLKNLKKVTFNGTWVFALKAQTLVADKRQVHTKKEMIKAHKEARKLLRSFKKLDAERAQEAEKICAKEKMKKTKVMKKPKAMRKSN